MKVKSLRRIGVCVFIVTLLNQLIFVCANELSSSEPNTSASAIENAGKAPNIPGASDPAEAVTPYRNGRFNESRAST